MSNYIFPKEARSQLGVAVALQLAQYLQNGDVDYDLDGLNVSPLFIIRAGSGIEGDETQSSGAEIIFPDDEKPGAPFVRIAQVKPLAAPDAWGDDAEVSLWQVTLDCSANEFQAAVTAGAQPGGSDAVLSDAVWHLLTHFDAMYAAGFVNAEATPGALDVEDLEYHIPITVTFEIYVTTV
jgi:hypothetical protein